MPASNTPLPDLIELSSIGEYRDFTTSPGGGGDIIGVVDNATYSDTEPDNTASEITELSASRNAHHGTLTIDGVTYSIQLHVPDSSYSDEVTVTYDNGASSVELTGNSYRSEVAFITASPLSGGADRYFALFDDDVGDLNAVTSIQTQGLDWDISDLKIDVEEDNSVTPVCFVAGTQIAVPDGTKPVEAIHAGDLVQTRDFGPQPVHMVIARQMRFEYGPHPFKAVEIKDSTLARGVPQRAVAVSPQHRILITTPRGERLAPAKAFLTLPGVRQRQGARRLRYYNLLLPRHALLCADGLWCESFWPGPTAVLSLSVLQRAQLSACLGAGGVGRYGLPVRPFLSRRRAEKVLQKLGKASGSWDHSSGQTIGQVRGQNRKTRPEGRV